jgi:ABC-type transport system involved in multi-copper enzyme maturation permease subunit
MIKLLTIELRKILPYRMFWIMAGIYVLSMLFIFYGFPSLIDYFSLRSQTEEIKLLKNFIYNFPDIWQNLTWVSSLRFFIKVMLGIIMVVLITNEYAYTTIRNNVISGMSRTDFLLGKVYMAIFLSLLSVLLVITSGLVLGLSFSSVTTIEAITGKLWFLVGYIVETFSYLVFALMLGLIVKRTGLAISFLFIYPIIELVVQQQIPESIHPYLPVNAMNHVIRTPNTSLIEYQSPDFDIDLQKYIEGVDILVCLGYAALFIFISYLILKKRDL